MKEVIILAIFFFLLSCKKEYKCECKDPVYGGYPGQTNSSFTTYKERKRETAQSACEARTAGLVGRTCALNN